MSIESRQERVLRLATLGDGHPDSPWRIIEVTGRRNWEWGYGLNYPEMKKAMLVMRKPDGELIVHKWLGTSTREKRWLPMSPRFSALFEMVVFPHV